LDHLGVVTAAPEMLTTPTNGTICGHRPFNLRHVAVLTNKPSLLHPVPVFEFSIGTARPSVIKLRWPPHNAMAPVTELGRAEAGIEFCGMRGDGIVKGSEDHPIPDVTGCAGDSFTLIVGIILRVRFLNGFFYSFSRNLFDQRGLLVF